MLWGAPPSIYSLPIDTPCEWRFRPSSSLLEFSQTPSSESPISTHIKLTGLESDLLRFLPKQLAHENSQIFFHGTGLNNESNNLHVEISEGLGDHFLDCFYLSLELLQGRAPKVVELVAHGRLEISKHSSVGDLDRFDLWTHHYSVSFIKELLPQLLLKLIQMPEDVFAPFRTTIKLISFGKTSQAPLEVKFLMLISALIMLSNANDDNLKDAVTAELLGIHKLSATLIRGLRNKLLHGGGSFHRAYPRAITDPKIALNESDCQVITNDLKIAITPSSCDFPRLWLRLCERLGAYLWVSLLGDSQKAKHKCYNVPHMPLPSGTKGLLAAST